MAGGNANIGLMMKRQTRAARNTRARREQTLARRKGSRHNDRDAEAWIYTPVPDDGAEYNPSWQQAGRVAEMAVMVLLMFLPIYLLATASW